MIQKIIFILILIIALAVGLYFYVARQTSPVVIEHTFNAPVAKVWTLWSEPELIKGWWSPKDFTAPVIKSDFRVGGTFLFSMCSPDGQMFWNTGNYVEVIPNQKIVYTMSFSDENGKITPGSEVPVPGKWPDEVIVTVDFKEVDGKTQVTVQQIGIPLVMKMMSKMGWQQQFDKLDQMIERK